jgi:hypothetical protein
MLKNVRDFVTELKAENSLIKDDVRISVLKDFLNEQLSLVGLRGLIQESGQEHKNIMYGIYKPAEPVEPGVDTGDAGGPDNGPSPANKLSNPSSSSGPSGGGGGSEPSSAATTPTPTPNVGGSEPEVIDIEDLGNQ